jgi:hypothetical protein
MKVRLGWVEQYRTGLQGVVGFGGLSGPEGAGLPDHGRLHRPGDGLTMDGRTDCGLDRHRRESDPSLTGVGRCGW